MKVRRRSPAAWTPAARQAARASGCSSSDCDDRQQSCGPSGTTACGYRSDTAARRTAPAARTLGGAAASRAPGRRRRAQYATLSRPRTSRRSTLPRPGSRLTSSPVSAVGLHWSFGSIELPFAVGSRQTAVESTEYGIECRNGRAGCGAPGLGWAVGGRPRATRSPMWPSSCSPSRGFDEVSVDDVAEAAGIARRTLFRYYPSKNAIPWGEFDAHLQQLRKLLAAVEPHACPSSRRCVMRCWRSTLSTSPRSPGTDCECR